ncbi:MAG: alpha/beta fold hydrolase [Candidatus Hydrogenedentes bacterium]|nr:alpha/beta fold hydrolase [Candidatus Hydrogenedentota bacterium]
MADDGIDADKGAVGDAARSRKYASLLLGGMLYAIALVLMRLSTPAGVDASPLRIEGPNGRPCTGALWLPADTPKAVMLIGHGVSTNQGVMATVAKAFAGQGYAAIAIDFFGHGRSRETFDWSANPAQVFAWCAWARESYPGVPLAYLGHSMGGFAGAEAFSDSPVVDAFVALGALPRRFPKVPTLVAAGQFEELFTPDEARRQAEGRAEVLISPWSNHVMEAWDPVLIYGIVDWVSGKLGLPSSEGPPWARWGSGTLATLLGCIGAFLLAAAITAHFRGDPVALSPPQSDRRWSLNPYRIMGRLICLRGYGIPPRGGSWLRAFALAFLYSGVLVVLLAVLLNRDIFTSRPDHPERGMAWLIALAIFMPVLLLDAFALERLPLSSARQRFLVPALTRGIPLSIAATAFWFSGPGPAFGGMLLSIFAFVAVVLALVHAQATKSAGDYRTGAIASSILLGWALMFWFPVTW